MISLIAFSPDETNAQGYIERPQSLELIYIGVLHLFASSENHRIFKEAETDSSYSFFEGSMW